MTNSKPRPFFIFEAEMLFSVRPNEWRILSNHLGWRERDVPIDSIPYRFRKSGLKVWVIWNRREDRLEHLFPRSDDEVSDLPQPWKSQFMEQESLRARGELVIENPQWLEALMSTKSSTERDEYEEK